MFSHWIIHLLFDCAMPSRFATKQSYKIKSRNREVERNYESYHELCMSIDWRKKINVVLRKYHIRQTYVPQFVFLFWPAKVKTDTKRGRKWLRSSGNMDRPRWTSKVHGRGQESQNRYVSCTLPKLRQQHLHRDDCHCRSSQCRVSFWSYWDPRANRPGGTLKALVNRVADTQKIGVQIYPPPFWSYEVLRRSICRTTYFSPDHRKPELQMKMANWRKFQSIRNTLFLPISPFILRGLSSLMSST